MKSYFADLSVKNSGLNTKFKFVLLNASLIFQAGRHARDLFEDLRDGHNLLSLLEVLSGEILVSPIG